MKSPSIHQTTAPEFAQSLAEAMKSAAMQGERSDGRHLDLAREARSLPAEVVDEAFSHALASTITDLNSQPSVIAELLIVAEQFADGAGANRFLEKTRLFVSDKLSRDRDQPKTIQGSAAEVAQIRARYLSLARAVGISISLERLETETELKEFAPLLWLDLANSELASGEFVERVEQFFSQGTFHPFALIPRLKSIFQKHGPGTAQSVLDAGYRKLFVDQKYAEADSLIDRANIVLPKGWERPPKREPFVPNAQTTETSKCIDAMVRHLQIGSDKPALVVRVIREMLDPVLSVSSDDQEEQRRDGLRQRLFRSLPDLPQFESVLLTGLLPDFRLPDVSGFDWWQDCGPWRLHLPKKSKFEKFVKSAATTEAVACWSEWTDGQEAEIVTTVDNNELSNFALIYAADRIGFGGRRRAAV